MNPWKKTLAGGILAASASCGSVPTIHAAEAVTIKPLQAVDFDFDNKRAVSFFSRVRDTCEVVLSMAEALDRIDRPSLMTSRFETVIAAGRVRRIRVAESKAVEFTCHKDAEFMSVRWLDQLASSSPAN